ncbi:MAG: host specificity factor TipJ family phage tail protein, partial [Corticimicrobacter sp.]|uniref:host specificity factor TipJ family phage tail protein n=1 Tax=Corticimicrobacter sp. TaxID=2678536 RepID=UPI0032DA95F2
FDTATTLWDALTRIARVGRAMPMYYAGVIDFIRNEPKSVKTQMYTPGNIVTSTFSIDYAFPQHDSPDHVIVEFTNEETWQPDEVVCALPDSLKMRPFRLQLPGVTNREQAWREGISLAAQNRDQRRFVSFQTELEGMIPRYADLVEISHDVPKWGLSGVVESYDPDAKKLVMSEPLEWWAGENHYINLRRRDGSPDGPYRVVAGSHDREIVIVDNIDGYSVYISNGQGEDSTQYQFGPGERRALLAQVVSATPDEEGRVAIEFVNYAPSVHSAEHGGVVPPPTPPSLLPSNPNAPVVDSVTVYAAAVPGQQVVSATPARGADRYEFRASEDAGATWIDLGTHLSSTITSTLQAGVWRVQARGIGTMQGPWATWQGIVSATMVPPPALASLTASPEIMAIRLDWALPAAPWIRSVEIWYSTDDDFLNASLLGEFRPTQRSHMLYGLGHGTALWFWARIRDEADQAGPWYPSVDSAGVRGQSSTDAAKLTGYITDEILKSALGEQIWNGIESLPEMQAQLDALSGAAQHDQAQSYLSGAVVFDDGKMYRARQDVPVGAPLTDEAYWQYVGDYASIVGAVAAVSLQVQENTQQIEDIGDVVAATATSASTMQSALREDDGEGRLADVLNEYDSRAWITDLRRTRVTAQQAEAIVQQQIGAQLGEVTAQVQDISQSVVNMEGVFNATRSVRLSVDANGTVYTAGYGIGLSNESGVTQSQFVVVADRFAVMHAAGGAPQAVFTIDQGTAILNSAIIGDASIGSAKFSDWLESDAIGPGGRPVLRLNFRTGEIQLNRATASGGWMQITNQAVKVYDETGLLRVQLGDLTA